MAALYWKVGYRYWTRPRYRKGRWATQEVTFKADNRMDALREAKKYAEMIWHRRKWEIVGCQPMLAAAGESVSSSGG